MADMLGVMSALNSQPRAASRSFKLLTWTKGRKSITRQLVGPDGKLRRVKKRRTPMHRADGILIRELPAKSGSTYFRVEVPASVTGKRILKQFKSLAEAEAYCALMQGQRERQGLAAFALGDTQRSIAQNCFKLLAENGFTCDDLEPAVRLYLRHHRPESGNITIDRLMGLYLRGKQDGTATQGGRPLRPRSLGDVENRLGVFARVFGSKWVQEVKADDLRKWLDDSAKSRQSRRNYFTVLNGMFNFAVSEKYAGSNPLVGIPKPAKPGDDEREIGVLTVEEAADLLHAAWAHAELELGWVGHAGSVLWCARGRAGAPECLCRGPGARLRTNRSRNRQAPAGPQCGFCHRHL